MTNFSFLDIVELLLIVFKPTNLTIIKSEDGKIKVINFCLENRAT